MPYQVYWKYIYVYIKRGKHRTREHWPNVIKEKGVKNKFKRVSL